MIPRSPSILSQNIPSTQIWCFSPGPTFKLKYASFEQILYMYLSFRCFEISEYEVGPPKKNLEPPLLSACHVSRFGEVEKMEQTKERHHCLHAIGFELGDKRRLYSPSSRKVAYLDPKCRKSRCRCCGAAHQPPRHHHRCSPAATRHRPPLLAPPPPPPSPSGHRLPSSIRHHRDGSATAADRFPSSDQI